MGCGADERKLRGLRRQPVGQEPLKSGSVNRDQILWAPGKKSSPQAPEIFLVIWEFGGLLDLVWGP